MLEHFQGALPSIISGIVMLLVGIAVTSIKNARASRAEEKRILDEVRGLVKKQEELKKTIKALSKGMKAEMRESLVDARKKYVSDGETLTVERYHEINEIYEAYRELGGNGTGERMFRDIQKVGPTILS